jgi:hypothetical protein
LESLSLEEKEKKVNPQTFCINQRLLHKGFVLFLAAELQIVTNMQVYFQHLKCEECHFQF